MTLISAPELAQRLQEPANLVDVRTPEEFRRGHIAGATLLPLQTLTPQQAAKTIDPARPTVLICQASPRAFRAAQALLQWGFDNLMVLEGGMNAWQQAGLPIETDDEALRAAS